MDTGLAPCLPPQTALCAEILAGLRTPQKRLPSKLFYDEPGSRLFDAICELPEYYITRTEQAIMRRHAAEICSMLGRGVRLVELGSGSSLKTRQLLDQLQPACYVPIDISAEHLLKTAAQLGRLYPELAMQPLIADFTAPFALPPVSIAAGPTVVYFPGSTLGNFEPREARALLRRIHALAGPGGGLLLGADLRKDRRVLEAAYNDTAGVTAAFNLNLLSRLNREFGADFRTGGFLHRAHYDERRGRIEMHLLSKGRQSFSIFGRGFSLSGHESLHTENSYKYSIDGLRRLAQATGFNVNGEWTDYRQYFTVQWWRVAG